MDDLCYKTFLLIGKHNQKYFRKKKKIFQSKTINTEDGSLKIM